MMVATLPATFHHDRNEAAYGGEVKWRHGDENGGFLIGKKISSYWPRIPHKKWYFETIMNYDELLGKQGW